MNKYFLPAILAVVVAIAGVYAFMPVEKASTVHGTIGTDIDNRDMAFSVAVNMSASGTGGAHTVIPFSSGRTLTGNYILSATANNSTSSGAGAVLTQDRFDCGLIDVDTNAPAVISATNASSAGQQTVNGSISLTSGQGIAVQYDDSNSDAGGICNVFIYLTSNNG